MTSTNDEVFHASRCVATSIRKAAHKECRFQVKLRVVTQEPNAKLQPFDAKLLETVGYPGVADLHENHY